MYQKTGYEKSLPSQEASSFSGWRFTVSAQERRPVLIEGVAKQRQEHDSGHHARHGNAEIFPVVIVGTSVEHADGVDREDRDESQEEHDEE